MAEMHLNLKYLDNRDRLKVMLFSVTKIKTLVHKPTQPHINSYMLRMPMFFSWDWIALELSNKKQTE